MMKQRLRTKLTLLTLSLGVVLGLGSCKDELSEAPQQRPSTEQQSDLSKPLEDYIGKANIVFQSEMSLEAIQSARMAYYLEDRDTRRGNRGSGEYKQELSPTMLVKKGDKFQSILIFMRVPKAGEAVQFVRKEVALEVIEAPEGIGASYQAGKSAIVRWVGDVDFPAPYTLTQEFLAEALINPPFQHRHRETVEGQWYVMATMGYNTAVYNTVGIGSGDKLLYNYISPEELEPLPDHDLRRFGGNFATAPAYTSKDNFFHIVHPHISDWKRLKIYKGESKWGGVAYTGLAEEVILRPQGTLLTYDLAINENLLQDIRGYGVVSNVVDFRGYYDISGQSLYNRFLAEGTSAKPEWVSVRNTPTVSFYDDDSNDNLLTAGERIYPFDLAATSGAYGPQMWGGSASSRLNLTDAPSMFYIYFIPGKASVMGTAADLADNSWMGNPLGSWMYQSGGWRPKETRRYLTIWGMPRAQRPSKPATYFFASVYPMVNSELYHQDFNPTSQVYDPGRKVVQGRYDIRVYQEDELTLPQRIADKNRQISDLESQIAQRQVVPTAESDLERRRREYEITQYSDALSAAKAELKALQVRQEGLPAEKQRIDREYPESLFTTYAADSTVFYGNYLPAYLRSGELRAQPWLTLHQSNTLFNGGRIYHARPTLTSDLLLTEVHYEMRNGHNYSTVEVYNPTWLPADLTRYAIARLIPSADGTHLAYRKYDGTTTENLAEAQLLPLSAVVPNQPDGNTPYTLSEFTAPVGLTWGQKPDDRIFPIANHQLATAEYPNRGLYPNKGLAPTGVGEYKNDDIYGAPQAYSQDMTHDIGSMKHYLLPRQTAMYGATGWVNQQLYNGWQYREPHNDAWRGANELGITLAEAKSRGWETYDPWNVVRRPESRPWTALSLDRWVSYGGPWINERNWRKAGTEWFEDYWRFYTIGSDYQAFARKNGHLRFIMAYADGIADQGTGTEHKYGEGTLDYRPGDAFVLVKKMPGGGLQVIDATGPVGRAQKAFPGTYADFKAEFDKYKTGYDHFSVQKLQAVDYPFIAPYKTARVPADQRYSSWSDTWRVVTNYSDYTTGIYTDPKILHTDFGDGLGPLVGLYGAPFPPYRRSVWKASEYDWQTAKRLKPVR